MIIVTLTSGTYIELDPGWNDPGWSRVPNSIARCPAVSRRFKGWALEVASHEPGRRIGFADMLELSTDGRDATYATIREGVKAGFVTRDQQRDASGRLGIVIYRLHVSQQNPRSEPLPEMPYTGEPDPVQPVTVNPETSKKTKNLEKTKTQEKTKDQSQKNVGDADAPLAAADAAPAPSRSSLEDDLNQDRSQQTRSKDRKPGKDEAGQPVRDDVDQLCAALSDQMIANGCKPPTVGERWRDAARLLLDRDGRPLEEALDVMAWVGQDEFWRINILSLPTFRAKYDRLRLAWLATNPVRHLRSEDTIKHWLRDEWRKGHAMQVSARSGLRYETPHLPDMTPQLHAQLWHRLKRAPSGDEQRWTSELANEWHAWQIQSWITANHGEIIARIMERESSAAS